MVGRQDRHQSEKPRMNVDTQQRSHQQFLSKSEGVERDKIRAGQDQ